MAGINKVILVGYLGKDPEIRVIESGRKVAQFSLATSESYKDKNGQRVDQTEWHNIVFWGPIADVIEKYLKKGSRIYVEGKIRTRSYEDKDKVKKYITEIMGREMTMLDNAPKSGDSSANHSKNGNAVPVGETHQGEDDDLPF
jgi:single-strand DNA-binding protein